MTWLLEACHRPGSRVRSSSAVFRKILRPSLMVGVECFAVEHRSMRSSALRRFCIGTCSCLNSVSDAGWM